MGPDQRVKSLLRCLRGLVWPGWPAPIAPSREQIERLLHALVGWVAIALLARAAYSNQKSDRVIVPATLTSPVMLANPQ